MTIVAIDSHPDLSNLLSRAEAGEEIVLTRGDVPVARIVPTHLPIAQDVSTKTRRIGKFKGMFSFDESVFKPLTDKGMIEYGFE